MSQQSDVQDWLALVRAEYLEMPGLRLTETQVRRLWGFDTEMCATVLGALIAQKFLVKTVQGAYVLADGEA